jgi:hypothetical protein
MSKLKLTLRYRAQDVHVRFRSKPEVAAKPPDVRSTRRSRHGATTAACPFCANKRHPLPPDRKSPPTLGASLFGEGHAYASIPCYRQGRQPETAEMWRFIFIVSIVSMPLATEMARERARSPGVWFWVAFFVGPLAPLALLILGDTKHSAPAN